MTKPDLDDLLDEPSDGAILVKRAALTIGGGIALIFILGMIAGYLHAVIDQGGPDFKDIAIIGAMLLMAALVAYAMRRFWPKGVEEPVSPRVKSARNLLWAAILLGLPLGFVIGTSEGGGSDFVSNSPIDPAIAAFIIGSLLVAGPILTWLWWQRIDEHEAGAYRDGGLIAVHAYLFVTPTWWIATCAGWLPPQEPMLVLLAVSAIWCLIWFIRRYF